MLCDICKKREASGTITQIKNGRKTVTRICSQCSLEHGFSVGPTGSGRGRKDPFGDFDSIFGSDLFGDIFRDFLGMGQPGERQAQERIDVQEYLTESARFSLSRSVEIAQKHFNPEVDTEHLLLALTEEQLIKEILKNLRISEADFKKEIDRNIVRGYQQVPRLEYSPKMKRVLDLSLAEAQSLRHNYVGPEHLLLALMAEGEGLASQILKRFKITPDQLKRAVTKAVGRGSAQGFIPLMDTPILDQFSRDLTQMAQQGKLDPVVGRANEIESAIEVLARRTKNNPVLIGEPGVGKTAIVEGLAQRIVSQNVPEPLQGKRVVELDLAQILAGTQFRGQFEDRIKKIIEEIKANSDKLIVFIDEIHLLVGAGTASESNMDAANMFKPALARGELHIVGATTLKEYQKYIEKDQALERRFQPIFVSEPTVGETIEILRGLRDRYESHHRVKISDDGIIAAAELSHRYISGRFLPDKAIDLIDQAAARVRIKFTTEPEELKKLEHKIKNLEKEKSAQRWEKDSKKAKSINAEIDKLKSEAAKIVDEWETKKAKITPEVKVEHIAEIISKLTGIPVTELTQAEREKLLKLEEKIQERLVGQGEAVTAAANAIRRGRAGLSDVSRPIASFLFLGPTGVGKTELARSLAAILFGEEDAMVRLDMSEYMEKHNVSRLIGAPPGYVGYEEGGQLTEAVRRRPHSIILLDEIEKAHPDVFNILLQVLEDGRLTDGQGRKVNFTNTIIIATSNLAWDEENLMDSLKMYFRPEFLNRLDEVVVFKSLSEEQIKEIVSLQLDKLREKLKVMRLDLEVSKTAVNQLAKLGYDPQFGARELRRMIQKHLENKISEKILSQSPEPGSTVQVDFVKDFAVQIKEPIKH